MVAVRRLLTILSLCLMATGLVAQTEQSSRKTEPVTAETDQDLNAPNALRLSLDEAVRMAMQRNLGIELQEFDYQMASYRLRGSYGIFDLFATGLIQQSSSESATISQFEPTGSRGTRLNFGVGQLIPTGGNYAVAWNNSRFTTAGGGTTVSPAYRSSLALEATQPLLRNFGVDVTKRGINIARNTLGINHELFRTVLMNTAVSVEQAYLDLIYARQNVDVVKESLFLARDQARITQIRIDVGASAPLDILQPRVSIATSEEFLIIAVASVRDAEDRLRALLNLDPAEWNRPIIPTDSVAYRPMTVDVDAAVARAFELRPEIRQSKLTTDTRRIEYVYARNQVLPQLDLDVTYNAAGLAGRSAEIDPVTQLPTGRINSTGYPRAFRQVIENEFPSWTVGLNVGVPIFNIGARSEAKRAELDLRRSRTEETQTRQNIALEVRGSARDIDSAARAITATRAAREAAEQNLDAERKRYENGMTTIFNVLQIQQQLSDARVREINALVGYNKAIANYHRAVGDVLETRNIALEAPELAQEPDLFNSFDRYNWLQYGSRVNVEEEKKNDDRR